MGYLSGNATFYGTSVNQSTDPTAIVGLPTFLDGASNEGTITSGVFSGSASNVGEVQAQATFAGSAINSGIVEVGVFSETAGNLGVISGSGSFVGTAINSGSVTIAEFCGSASNAGVISNTAIFNDTASNAGTVATATFSESSINAGVVSGSGLFIGNASNSGTATLAAFSESASNIGTVITATFSDTASNVGVISGSAAFAGNSSNNGTVQAATFSESALNSGSVSVAIFSGSATNLGTVSDTASFFGTASNNGTVEVAVFNEGAINLGVISGSGLFFGTAVNSGIISGDAIFADTAANNGSVEGNANFSATASNEGGTVVGVTGSFVRNGPLSNGYYLNDVINTDYNSSVPESAIDNNVWYIYSNGVPALATGFYSTAYFVSGAIGFNYTSLIPRTVQNDNLYYTFSVGLSSLANGAYSVGYYSTGEIEAGFNSAVPIDTIDSNYYTFSNGVASIATGAYSNGYYLNGNINTAYTQTGVLAQDNNLYYNYVSGVASLAASWYSDTSSANRIITLNGTVTESNEGNGVKAALFDGSTSYLRTTPINLGTGDLTLELFVNHDSDDTNIGVFLNGGNGGLQFGHYIAVNNVLYIGLANIADTLVSNYTQIAGDWHHIAYVRSGGTGTLYVDGVSATSGPDNNNYGNNPIDVGAFVGYGAGDYDFKGKMAGIRVTTTAVYTSNFTVPTTLPTSISGTQLLLNFGATAVPTVTIKNGAFSTGYLINNIIDTNYNNSTPVQAQDDGKWYTYASGIATAASGAYSNGYYASGELSGTYAAPVQAQDDAGWYTYASGVASAASGAYSNWLIVNGATDNSSTPIQAQDDGVWYTYNAISGSFVANGAHSNGYYSSGNLDSSANYATPTQAQDDNKYYTYAVGAATAASGAYSNGYYANGEIDVTYNASTPTDDAQDDTKWYTYASGAASAASGAYSNGYYASGEIDTNYNSSSMAQDNNTWYTYTSGVAGTYTLSWYDDSSSVPNSTNLNGTIIQSDEGGGVIAAEFDGSSSLSIIYSDNSEFNFGTEDFTIEMFVKPFNTNSGEAALVTTAQPTDAQGLLLGVFTDANGQNIYDLLGNGSWQYAFGEPYGTNATNFPTYNVNVWQHIAWVRSGNTFTLYKNGVSVKSYSATVTLTNTNNTLHVGGRAIAGSYFKGKIAGLRIVKGSALYTSGFTVPTTLPTDVTGTVMLLNFGASNAPTPSAPPAWYDDASSTPATVTLNGTITESDEGGGVIAASFDGNSSFTIPSTSNLDISSSSFTIELWFKVNSYDAANSAALISKDTVAFAYRGSYEIVAIGGTSKVNFSYSSSDAWGAPEYEISSVDNISLNTWYHVAVSRDISTNTLRFFLNGVLQVEQAFITMQDFGRAITIGRTEKDYPGSILNGKIAGVRIVKGSALYTSNFTVPTSLPTDVSGTVLLLNFGATAIPSV